MRVLNRLIAASVATLVVGLMLAIVPTSPASAAAGVHVMSAGVATTAEGNSGSHVVTVTISLNFAPFPGENISATVSTADGSARSGATIPDYVAKSQTVTFPCDFSSCSTTQPFDVTVNGDTSKEPDETIRIVLSNVQGADKGSDGTVNISNDDGGPTPTFIITNSPAANEGNADNVRTVKVQVTNPSTDQAMHLAYATFDDSATANASKGTPDYVATAGTLTWAANDGADQSINITVKGDALGEPNERFAVNFGSPDNAALPTNQSFVALNNDDGAAPVITLAPTPPKDEGDTATSDMLITVLVSQAAPQILTVDYTTADGSAVIDDDYEETKGTLTISQGQSSKTVAVPIVGDQAAEPDETFTFTLTKATNATLGDPASQANTIRNDDFGQITTTPGPGRIADIRQFGPAGALLAGFAGYEPAFTGGAHVARGDFFKADGSIGADGIDEIIVGPGQNSRPLVKILNQSDGAVRASFFPYDQNFRGGVFVAAGNLDADAANGDELIVAAGPGGGPHVRVLRVTGSANFTELAGAMVYDPRFGGGVHVTAGDLVGDVRDEIVVAPAGGGGPHVRVITISPQGQPSIASEFMAYDPNFSGGVSVAVGGKKLITGAGRGGGPHVRIWSGTATPEGGFMAYAPEFTGGVSVGAGNLDGDLAPEIVTGPGAGGGPHVRVFDLDGSLPFGGGFFAYEDSFGGGVEVAIGNG